MGDPRAQSTSCFFENFLIEGYEQFSRNKIHACFRSQKIEVFVGLKESKS